METIAEPSKTTGGAGNPDPTQPPDMRREQRNIKNERRQETDSLPKEKRPERGRQKK